MKDSELSLGRKIRRIPRASVRVALLSLVGGSLLAVACNTQGSENSTPISSLPTTTPMTDSFRGNHWFDKRLAETNDPIFKSVELYFDPNYSGGSLAINICFNISKGEVRIISRQLNGNQGFLYNRPTDITEPCHLFHPVIEVGPDERDQINLGGRTFDQPYDDTYVGEGYVVTRLGNTQDIDVKPVVRQTIDPNSIIPRDPSTAKDNFKR